MSGFYVPDGRDIDALFEFGDCGWDVGFTADDGRDVARRFAFKNDGSPLGWNTGFVTPDGHDFGNYFCAKGSAGATMVTGGWYVHWGTSRYGFLRGYTGSLTKDSIGGSPVIEAVSYLDNNYDGFVTGGVEFVGGVRWSGAEYIYLILDGVQHHLRWGFWYTNGDSWAQEFIPGYFQQNTALSNQIMSKPLGASFSVGLRL